MEETLGKRIVANRRRLGLTQDALAEQLGVTAQAVSKWENDQSCPDIAMLPKLAKIFGITTDALLGLEPVQIAQPARQETDDEPEGIHFTKGQWEVQLDGGRRSGIGLAVWLLAAGILLFLVNDVGLEAGLWDILWTTGLLTFGLFGLIYPRFSLFRLFCSFWGGYFLCVEVFGRSMNADFLLSVSLILFGISLLIRALRRPREGSFHLFRNGKNVSSKQFSMDGEGFFCTTSFSGNRHLITLPRISHGEASVSFGDLEVDLTGCEEFAANCRIRVDCSFGELRLLVPKNCRVESHVSTAFGAFETRGEPENAAQALIELEGNVSFGEVMLKYI